jgi:hypothetical protein
MILPSSTDPLIPVTAETGVAAVEQVTAARQSHTSLTIRLNPVQCITTREDASVDERSIIDNTSNDSAQHRTDHNMNSDSVQHHTDRNTDIGSVQHHADHDQNTDSVQHHTDRNIDSVQQHTDGDIVSVQQHTDYDEIGVQHHADHHARSDRVQSHVDRTVTMCLPVEFNSATQSTLTSDDDVHQDTIIYVTKNINQSDVECEVALSRATPITSQAHSACIYVDETGTLRDTLTDDVKTHRVVLTCYRSPFIPDATSLNWLCTKTYAARATTASSCTSVQEGHDVNDTTYLHPHMMANTQGRCAAQLRPSTSDTLLHWLRTKTYAETVMNSDARVSEQKGFDVEQTCLHSHVMMNPSEPTVTFTSISNIHGTDAERYTQEDSMSNTAKQSGTPVCMQQTMMCYRCSLGDSTLHCLRTHACAEGVTNTVAARQCFLQQSSTSTPLLHWLSTKTYTTRVTVTNYTRVTNRIDCAHENKREAGTIVSSYASDVRAHQEMTICYRCSFFDPSLHCLSVHDARAERVMRSTARRCSVHHEPLNSDLSLHWLSTKTYTETVIGKHMCVSIEITMYVIDTTYRRSHTSMHAHDLQHLLQCSAIGDRLHANTNAEQWLRMHARTSIQTRCDDESTYRHSHAVMNQYRQHLLQCAATRHTALDHLCTNMYTARLMRLSTCVSTQMRVHVDETTYHHSRTLMQKLGPGYLLQFPLISDRTHDHQRTSTYADRMHTVLGVNTDTRLHSHMLMQIDASTFDDIPSTNIYDTGSEHNETNECRCTQDKIEVLLCHPQHEPNIPATDAVEEAAIITQLADTYVRCVVERPTHINQRHCEVSVTRMRSNSNEDDVRFITPYRFSCNPKRCVPEQSRQTAVVGQPYAYVRVAEERADNVYITPIKRSDDDHELVTHSTTHTLRHPPHTIDVLTSVLTRRTVCSAHVCFPRVNTPTLDVDTAMQAEDDAELVNQPATRSRRCNEYIDDSRGDTRLTDHPPSRYLGTVERTRAADEERADGAYTQSTTHTDNGNEFVDQSTLHGHRCHEHTIEVTACVHTLSTVRTTILTGSRVAESRCADTVSTRRCCECRHEAQVVVSSNECVRRTLSGQTNIGDNDALHVKHALPSCSHRRSRTGQPRNIADVLNTNALTHRKTVHTLVGTHIGADVITHTYLHSRTPLPTRCLQYLSQYLSPNDALFNCLCICTYTERMMRMNTIMSQRTSVNVVTHTYLHSNITMNTPDKRCLLQHTSTGDALLNCLCTNAHMEGVLILLNTQVSAHTLVHVITQTYLYSHILIHINECTVALTPMLNINNTSGVNGCNERGEFIHNENDAMLPCQPMNELREATPSTHDQLRKTVHAYAHEVVERLKTVHEQVIDILQSVNNKRQQHIDDVDVDNDVITAGDSVFLYDETTPVNRSRKLIKRWKGPFVVTATHNNNTSTILKQSGESTVSNDRLRKVNEDQTSIQDMHQRDIALATEELTAINDSIAALLQRQVALKQIAEVAEHANNHVNEHARAVANDDVNADEHKYDDENDVDEEEVELNGIIIEQAFVTQF